MSGAPVELKVGGQTYRVVTSAPRADLERLAGRVDGALRSIMPTGRQASDQSFVLAAIALAHDLEKKEEELQELEQRYRAKLQALLAGVDDALTLLGADSEGASPEEVSEPDSAPAEVYSLRKNHLTGSRYER